GSRTTSHIVPITWRRWPSTSRGGSHNETTQDSTPYKNSRGGDAVPFDSSESARGTVWLPWRHEPVEVRRGRCRAERVRARSQSRRNDLTPSHRTVVDRAGGLLLRERLEGVGSDHGNYLRVRARLHRASGTRQGGVPDKGMAARLRGRRARIRVEHRLLALRNRV